MKCFLPICTALAMFMAAGSAHAEMSTVELLEMYDNGDAERRELLETVIDGNANGVSWMNSYLDEFRGPGHQVYCPPDEFVTDGAGMIEMMRTAIKNDPRYAQLPYGATVMFTFIDYFPCP